MGDDLPLVGLRVRGPLWGLRLLRRPVGLEERVYGCEGEEPVAVVELPLLLPPYHPPLIRICLPERLLRPLLQHEAPFILRLSTAEKIAFRVQEHGVPGGAYNGSVKALQQY